MVLTQVQQRAHHVAAVAGDAPASGALDLDDEFVRVHRRSCLGNDSTGRFWAASSGPWTAAQVVAGLREQRLSSSTTHATGLPESRHSSAAPYAALPALASQRWPPLRVGERQQGEQSHRRKADSQVEHPDTRRPRSAVADPEPTADRRECLPRSSRWLLRLWRVDPTGALSRWWLCASRISHQMAFTSNRR